jgi:hypothetical protein
MNSHVLGIDFGSTTSKVVILDEQGEIVATSISGKGVVSDEGARQALRDAFDAAGLELKDIARVVSTGYGRRMLDIADRTITEITCHARGALALVPEAKLVIDIGGQDSKVIAIDSKGNVGRFAMNDRCAAGTGKFLEVLARAVNVELEEMGSTALSADNTVSISRRSVRRRGAGRRSSVHCQPDSRVGWASRQATSHRNDRRCGAERCRCALPRSCAQGKVDYSRQGPVGRGIGGCVVRIG